MPSNLNATSFIVNEKSVMEENIAPTGMPGSVKKTSKAPLTPDVLCNVVTNRKSKNPLSVVNLSETVNKKDVVDVKVSKDSSDPPPSVKGSVVIPKQPFTRKDIDFQVAEVKKKLDDALRDRAFAKCGPLQASLDELVQKQAEMPTISELRQAVKAAEAVISEATEKREFGAAAAGQTELDEAKAHLADALSAQGEDDDIDEASDSATTNPYGFDSRAQLEDAISSLTEQVKSAIKNKDFKTASLHQKTLDEREGLRKFFPSVEEIEAELRTLNDSMQNALSMKEFAKAEKIDSSITEMEKKLLLEREKRLKLKVGETGVSFKSKDGVEMVFESRGDLEKEIKLQRRLVSEAVKAKQFKEADALQADVDLLSKLRERLPSVTELKKDLSDMEKKMAAAIASKAFAEAEKISSSISHLEESLALEKSIASTQTSVSTPGLQVDSRNTALKPVSIRKNNAPILSCKRYPMKSNSTTKTGKKGKPVSKLRPANAITSEASANIRSVTQLLARKRGSASVIVSSDGSLCGIVTDTDITRRVVAKHVDPDLTDIQDVMTPNPTCVSTSEPAMEALATMVDNRFRHLPVLDETGAVAGCLDIAKCLNDAISKLEKSQDKTGSAAEDAVKKLVSQQCVQGNQAAAMQALLGTVMAQAFGDNAPTLRSLLSGKPTTLVSSTTSIRDAGHVMAESRKAALIVDDGRLVGIFGFKDMMNRAVARNIDIDSVPVSEVMTPDPEYVSPDMAILEALQTMHDNKFLTLPVCEDNGEIVGLVDVMDVICGCGGSGGWHSLFSSAMAIEDDVSDFVSVKRTGKSSVHVGRRTSTKTVSLSLDERPVSKLRPSKPILSRDDDSILRVSQVLASKRGAASLVVGTDGSLSGILTDTDITRRVVAKNYDPEVTTVESAMTSNPSCVSTSDSAIEALMTMVDNNFRHLPVIDDGGSVVGLLDIAKCLNDAIGRLEKTECTSRKDNSTAAKAVQKMVNQQAGDPKTAAVQALLGQLMSQALGNESIPTLRSLLEGITPLLLSPSMSIRGAGVEMANKRKAALIVEDDKLIGIFGFKDMMTRAVAKGRDLDDECVGAVMTEDPEFVSPDTTVLEALQVMHDSGFLNLPVCELNGTVLGVVGVVDLINGCGTADWWRSIFSKAMEDDQSVTGSVVTYDSHRPRKNAVESAVKKKQTNGHEKSVASLRPRKPHISNYDDSILAVTQLLVRKRGDASIIVDQYGSLSGIITDTDITRRVVATYVDPAATSIADVMTPNPTCVLDTDSAMDALTTMIENHFRHVPVTNSSGSVVGVLDIAKCLNDAISKMEQSQGKNSATVEDATKQIVTGHGMQQEHAAALQAMLGSLLSQALGSNTPNPTLRQLLTDKPTTIVESKTSIRDAGFRMAENRKAALVVDEGELVGIFGFKDMMNRAVAKELDLDATEISTVMTPDPEFVSPDIHVLDALQTMHDNNFLTLPVCEDDGTVVGLVDVMDVIYGCGGSDGWKSIFSNTMNMDGISDTASQSRFGSSPVTQAKSATPYVRKVPTSIPTTLEFDSASVNGSTIFDERGVRKLTSSDNISTLDAVVGTFKILAPDGSTHRVRCAARVDDLLDVAAERVNIPRKSLQVQYTDEEGDTVAVTDDDDVAEAWALSQKAGQNVAKMVAVAVHKPNVAIMYSGLAGIALTVTGVLALALLRPSKR